MANFNYEITYNGKRVATGLFDEINKTLYNKNVLSHLKLIETQHSSFDSAYKFEFSQGNIVRVSFNKIPGKLEGTEGVRIEFSGLEKDILETKNLLLKSIDGLELK